MNIVMTFKLEWNKRGGEKLTEFKKKYDSLKHHVEVMQLRGLMPRGEVRWVITRAPDPIPLPPAPVAQQDRLALAPMNLVHTRSAAMAPL